jgi:hypothetical protein
MRTQKRSRTLEFAQLLVLLVRIEVQIRFPSPWDAGGIIFYFSVLWAWIDDDLFSCLFTLQRSVIGILSIHLCGMYI